MFSTPFTEVSILSQFHILEATSNISWSWKCGSISGLYSILMLYGSVFRWYHILWITIFFVIYFEIRKYSAFSWILLFQYFRLFVIPLCFHMNLMILFYFVKNAIGILIVIVLNLHVKNFYIVLIGTVQPQ